MCVCGGVGVQGCGVGGGGGDSVHRLVNIMVKSSYPKNY